ncbi:CPCC family cysteine-rich protein [Paenibacillus sp. WQ 127069]|uniref:CPCC family cysteine-rich protein n=1 Tax=Paenibacillus baimaensis TaxID=2982185 RepID=A0ABT2UFW2_9BACL|nr:CPCC family cysteine-rich protein [Paenibacillus sp. WQ 127069]MCU6793518.1 CPCC family cysteine-rich protein [Paenibacillus sp. WQ 127069]
MSEKYTCPCCVYKTLEEEPPGTDLICEICFWHDDYVQFHDPDYEGGANEVSLRQGQRSFVEFGACEGRCKEFVRIPSEIDERDLSWIPLLDKE